MKDLLKQLNNIIDIITLLDINDKDLLKQLQSKASELLNYVAINETTNNN